MNETVAATGLALIAVIVVAYAWYCLCLSLVFRKLQTPWWQAFIPGYNFMALMSSVGLPRHWFFYALVPYVGFVYSLATAERLGRAFGKSFAYSATWLTVGAFIGMARLGFLKDEQPDLSIKELPVPSILQLKKLRQRKEKLDKKK